MEFLQAGGKPVPKTLGQYVNVMCPKFWQGQTYRGTWDLEDRSVRWETGGLQGRKTGSCHEIDVVCNNLLPPLIFFMSRFIFFRVPVFAKKKKACRPICLVSHCLPPHPQFQCWLKYLNHDFTWTGFFFARPLHSLKITSVNIEIGCGGSAMAAFLGNRLFFCKHRSQIFTFDTILRISVYNSGESTQPEAFQPCNELAARPATRHQCRLLAETP